MHKTYAFLFALTMLCSACATSDPDTTNEPAPKEAENDGANTERPEEPESVEEPVGRVEPEVSDSAGQWGKVWDAMDEDLTEGYEFMIILSSKNFDKTVEYAAEAAENLQIDLRIGGLEMVDGYVSFPETRCAALGHSYPCYEARGNESGNYVSIEQSDAYVGFTSGYFIVIVSSGGIGNSSRRDFLGKVKEFYEDAYIKATPYRAHCGH